ncbi:MAG TPA: hypothetical protein VGI16_02780 [Candidatus Acidoferrum sp.]
MPMNSVLLFLSSSLGQFLILLGGFFLLSVLAPAPVNHFFGVMESSLARFARHSTLAAWLLFLSVIAIRLAALPVLRTPVPGIHDEFSYLLMGDTFAHGRLANPPHSMWLSFETFHVNWFPTYSSKYPPAQGAILALGEILGHPWIGVLLSCAAMCAVIFWMLRAWMPPRWALLGACLAALKLGVASYWMNSYWGGAAGAIGGALVLGALGRILKRPRVRDSLLFAFGIAILANSRPYEGLLLSVPVAFVLLWWIAGNSKHTPKPSVRVNSVLLPILVVLALTAFAMGYYNYRLTGKALLTPYALNSRTYDATPLFFGGHPKPAIAYNNKQIADFYDGWERRSYGQPFKSALTFKLKSFRKEFLWAGAILLLPALPFLFRDRKMRLPITTLLIAIAGSSLVVWGYPHYIAPITCAIYGLIAQAIRHLRTMHGKTIRWGIALSRAVILLLVIDTISAAAHGECDPIGGACAGNLSRPIIDNFLQREPGHQLVLVRYATNHIVHNEWVYNAADVDNSKVVWARELDDAQNQKLLSYYRNRHIWVVEADPAFAVFDPKEALHFLKPYSSAAEYLKQSHDADAVTR